MTGIIRALANSIVQPVVSAISTVRLALRRFRSEKWWERKADSYSRIIEALHQLKRTTQSEINAIHADPGEEASAEIGRIERESHSELHRAIDTGSILLSTEA